jgi:ribosomal-protein-alanine N-acetyltransferase
VIRTDRLWLRPFAPRDRDAFVALNADPEVMHHFPATLTAAETDAMLARIAARWQSDGISFAAVERLSDGAFLGMVGIAVVYEVSPALDGGLEIGWRLARAHWGQGYATEAARAWLAEGLARADRVVAFTARPNRASQAVMGRIGMHRAPDLDFDHPRIPAGHPLRRHLVWRADRA